MVRQSFQKSFKHALLKHGAALSDPVREGRMDGSQRCHSISASYTVYPAAYICSGQIALRMIWKNVAPNESGKNNRMTKDLHAQKMWTIQISFKKIGYKIANRLPQIDRQQMGAYMKTIDSEGEKGLRTAEVTRSLKVKLKSSVRYLSRG